MASTDAKPVPQKNVAYRITFPILDADGDLVTGATGLDSEVSKDGGTFADCTNEATEIATNSGMYYLDLTSTEMNADTVAVIVKTSSTGAKTTPIVMYPEEAGDIRVNVTAYGGTAGTFASGRPEVNMTHIAGSAVSTSTAQLGVNVVSISGDATAADNLEAALDGTGGVTITAGLTGNITGNLSGSIGSLGATAKSDVNAEVVDALATDTYVEPSAAPAATAALSTKINWLAALARNKITQTATTQTLRNDADSGNIATAAVSDDGTTFTRAEWS